jgi:hypothetical protein
MVMGRCVLRVCARSVVPYSGIQLMSFDQYSQFMLRRRGARRTDRLSGPEKMLTGAMAGATPTPVLRCRCPALPLSSTVHGAFQCTCFVVHAACAVSDGSAGTVSFAGATSVLVTYPLDLMRARLAVQRVVHKYESLPHAFSTAIREEVCATAMLVSLVRRRVRVNVVTMAVCCTVRRRVRWRCIGVWDRRSWASSRMPALHFSPLRARSRCSERTTACVCFGGSGCAHACAGVTWPCSSFTTSLGRNPLRCIGCSAAASQASSARQVGMDQRRHFMSPLCTPRGLGCDILVETTAVLLLLLLLVVCAWSAAATYPLDLARRRMQTESFIVNQLGRAGWTWPNSSGAHALVEHSGNNVKSIWLSIIRREGYRGLVKVSLVALPCPVAVVGLH